MRDRVAQNPGRVLVTPESGEPFYATLTRADNPTQEGTPLSKGNLLSDAAAALFGLGDDGTVSDALRLIGRLNSGLGNEWIWAKQKDVNVYRYPNGFTYAGGDSDVVSTTKNFYTTSYNNSGSYSIMTASSYTKDASTGKYTLTNAVSTPLNEKNSLPTAAIGKYVVANKVGSDTYYKITSNSSSAITGTVLLKIKRGNGTAFDAGTSGYQPIHMDWIDFVRVLPIKTEIGHEIDRYVNSPDENAYSETPDDEGYYYKKIGRVGGVLGGTKLVLGGYVGTGTYGENNPNVITFDGKPMFVRCYSNGSTVDFQRGDSDTQSVTWADANSNKVTLGVIWGENRLSFYRQSGYSSREAFDQLNTAGREYKYIAILV